MTVEDYRIALERCKLRAEHASDEEARGIWLSLVESYRNLLKLEQIEICGALISGKRFE